MLLIEKTINSHRLYNRFRISCAAAILIGIFFPGLPAASEAGADAIRADALVTSMSPNGVRIVWPEALRRLDAGATKLFYSGAQVPFTEQDVERELDIELEPHTGPIFEFKVRAKFFVSSKLSKSNQNKHGGTYSILSADDNRSEAVNLRVLIDPERFCVEPYSYAKFKGLSFKKNYVLHESISAWLNSPMRSDEAIFDGGGSFLSSNGILMSTDGNCIFEFTFGGRRTISTQK